MTRYRLPEVLGGGEFEAISSTSRTPVNPNLIGLRVGGVYVWIPEMVLTEVKPPPLPEEPPPGYYLARDSAQALVAEHEDGYGWHISGYHEGFMWSEICTRWPSLEFVRLVPDPFAEPTDLPWSIGTAQGRDEFIVVPESYLVRVGVAEGTIRKWTVPLSTEAARWAARALWAAASAVEARDA